MPSDRYRPRTVDTELERRLRSSGAVVIEGPKACGKTATGRQRAESVVTLDTDPDARQLVHLDPGLLLAGPTPRLLDEWQVEPALWNHVRRAVDDRREPGQFILTGSAVPADDVVRHTGAGRLSRLRMRPMSLLELGESTGEVSLAALLNGEPARCGSLKPGLEWHAELIAGGGWPATLGLEPQDRRMYVLSYIEEVCRTDIHRVDGVQRDPSRVRDLLRSLARNVSTEVSLATLARDLGGADGPWSRDTVRSYLGALERLMVLEDQRAWGPHLRSRARVRQSPKRHFVDPSIAVAALGSSAQRLLGDLDLLGLLFESLVVRDLRVYAQASGGEILHYRDATGLEADAIVELQDGRWAAFEVKLGTAAVDTAAESLLRLAERVDTDRCGPPAALGVITGMGYGYRRPDGVNVIPIGALGP